jgi:hypothetical protein
MNRRSFFSRLAAATALATLTPEAFADVQTKRLEPITLTTFRDGVPFDISDYTFECSVFVKGQSVKCDVFHTGINELQLAMPKLEPGKYSVSLGHNNQQWTAFDFIISP